MLAVRDTDCESRSAHHVLYDTPVAFFDRPVHPSLRRSRQRLQRIEDSGGVPTSVMEFIEAALPAQTPVSASGSGACGVSSIAVSRKRD